MQGITNKNKLHNYNHKKNKIKLLYTPTAKKKRNWILIKLSAGQKDALCDQGSKKRLIGVIAVFPQAYKYLRLKYPFCPSMCPNIWMPDKEWE